MLDEEMLLAELERMPPQQAAAVRVLYVADDPTSNAKDLALAVSADPILTAQVMRLANSAYYGLSGRVRSADFAVTVLGFSTVRSIAAASAAGALGEGARLPVGFWEHAAATATAAAQISGRHGVARPEAFSLGLLHDLGAAVLCRVDAERYTAIEESVDRPDSRQAALHEKRSFGMDHAAVAAVVLDAWRFPEEMVEAIGSHHERTLLDPSPLQRCLAGGQALAELSAFDDFQRWEANQVIPALEEQLRIADVPVTTAFDLSRAVRTEAAGIAASFSDASGTR